LIDYDSSIFADISFRGWPTPFPLSAATLSFTPLIFSISSLLMAFHAAEALFAVFITPDCHAEGTEAISLPPFLSSIRLPRLRR
jgi:hypothetical protein